MVLFEIRDLKIYVACLVRVWIDWMGFEVLFFNTAPS
jgi:hypothetical protein